MTVKTCHVRSVRHPTGGQTQTKDQERRTNLSPIYQTVFLTSLS